MSTSVQIYFPRFYFTTLLRNFQSKNVRARVSWEHPARGARSDRGKPCQSQENIHMNSLGNTLHINRKAVCPTEIFHFQFSIVNCRQASSRPSLHTQHSTPNTQKGRPLSGQPFEVERKLFGNQTFSQTALMESGMSASSAEISRTMLVEQASERFWSFAVNASRPAMPSLQILKVESTRISVTS